MTGIKEMIGKTAEEIWGHLPAWYIYIGITSITFSYLSLLPDPRYVRALTFIFPTLLFVPYYLIRIRRGEGITPENRRKISGIFLFAFSVNLGLIILFAFPVTLGSTPASHAANYKVYFEVSVLLVEILLLVHCYQHRRNKDFFLFLFPALIYGLTLENSGVSLLFFFEDHYLIYLPGFSAPLVTMLGWVSTLYIAIFVSERLSEAVPVTPKRRELIQHLIMVPAAAILLDLQLDPFATEIGLWKWNPLLYGDGCPVVMGVPLLNFFAWFGAVFAYSFFYFVVMKFRFSRHEQMKKAVILTLLIPVLRITAALVIFSLAGLAEGFDGPSITILKAGLASAVPF